MNIRQTRVVPLIVICGLLTGCGQSQSRLPLTEIRQTSDSSANSSSANVLDATSVSEIDAGEQVSLASGVSISNTELGEADALRSITLIPTSVMYGQAWKYTIVEPTDGWEKLEFDDSEWLLGIGGFGDQKTLNSVVRSGWVTRDIWMRRTFNFSSNYGEIRLKMHHDADVEVYFDGILATKATGSTKGYRAFSVSEAAWVAASKGCNKADPDLGPHTLAVHCKQSQGSRYIDLGIDLVPFAK